MKELMKSILSRIKHLKFIIKLKCLGVIKGREDPIEFYINISEIFY
jgi:hypothetical protein